MNVSGKRDRTRRGAVVLESAVVLSVLLLILFFTFDVGLAVVRYNLLSAAARAVARQAIVHGTMSSPELTTWGPAAVSGTAADATAPAAVAAPLLATMTTTDVALSVEWPDGDNRTGDRVRVTLSYVHTPHVPLIDLGNAFHLRAQSTMQIIH